MAAQTQGAADGTLCQIGRAAFRPQRFAKYGIAKCSSLVTQHTQSELAIRRRTRGHGHPQWLGILQDCRAIGWTGSRRLAGTPEEEPG